MDGILGYVKNIFCLYLLISVFDNLIANEKYKKYIRLFTGLILLAVILSPVLSIMDIDGFIKGLAGVENDYAISADVQKSILAAEAEKNQEIINTYLSELAAQVNEITMEFDLEVLDYDIRINQDETDEDFGSIQIMQLVLGEYDDGKIAIQKVEAVNLGEDSLYSDISEEPGIVSIKNKLANFYNIPLSNIYISIGE